MKIALSLAVAFSILTGAGTYAYLAAATAHAERDGSNPSDQAIKPISQPASR